MAESYPGRCAGPRRLHCACKFCTQPHGASAARSAAFRFIVARLQQPQKPCIAVQRLQRCNDPPPWPRTAVSNRLQGRRRCLQRRNGEGAARQERPIALPRYSECPPPSPRLPTCPRSPPRDPRAARAFCSKCRWPPVTTQWPSHNQRTEMACWARRRGLVQVWSTKRRAVGSRQSCRLFLSCGLA